MIFSLSEHRILAEDRFEKQTEDEFKDEIKDERVDFNNNDNQIENGDASAIKSDNNETMNNQVQRPKEDEKAREPAFDAIKMYVIYRPTIGP